MTIDPIALLGTGYGLVPLFSILSIRFPPNRMRFSGWYSLCVFLLFWFGSASLDSFEPLPVSGRMILPALPGLYITAGYFAARLRVAGAGRDARSRILVRLAILGVAALPLGAFLYGLQRVDRGEEEAMALLRDEAVREPKCNLLLVCGDERSPEALAFYFGFEYPDNLSVVSVADPTEEMLRQSDCTFLFLHEERSRFLESAYGGESFEREIRRLDPGKEDLLTGSENVFLWKAPSGERLAELIRDGMDSASADKRQATEPFRRRPVACYDGRSRRSFSRSSHLSRNGRP